MMELNIWIQFPPKHTKLKLVLGPNLILIGDLPEFQVHKWHVTVLQDAYMLFIPKLQIFLGSTKKPVKEVPFQLILYKD